MGEFNSIPATRLTGDEAFRVAGQPLGLTVLDFWRWGCSDLVSNATRAVIAEFLVASAIGVSGGVREEWSAFDLLGTDGTRIEIKASAYIQGWYQDDLSRPVFSCKPSRGWSRTTGEMSNEIKRQADVYVFCLHAHCDQETLDVLDVAQWEFYVVPTVVLDERTRSQHSITLPSLKKLTDAVSYADIEGAVAKAAATQKAARELSE